MLINVSVCFIAKNAFLINNNCLYNNQDLRIILIFSHDR